MAAIEDELSYQSVAEWNSLAHVSLMLALEKAYGITIDDETMLTLVDVAAIRRWSGRGAASGVVLSIAACTTGTDVAKVRQLPRAENMPDEVVMQKIHRGGYSHMYSFTGARIVEVGDMNDCLAEEMEAAITCRTAAIAFLLGPRILRQGLTLEDVVAIGRRRKIPVVVDAAAMLPPKANLRHYIDLGADLVTFSGGKMSHGPQSTGLLCGRRDLSEACMANVSPKHAIGRPHKVSRVNMMGLYVALKHYLETDEDKLLEDYRARLNPVLSALRNIEGVSVTAEHDDNNYNVPVVAISFTSTWRGPSGKEMTEVMLRGEPKIFMQYFASLEHLVVNPISLQPGEAEVVAGRLKAELERYSTPRVQSLVTQGCA